MGGVLGVWRGVPLAGRSAHVEEASPLARLVPIRSHRVPRRSPHVRHAPIPDPRPRPLRPPDRLRRGQTPTATLDPSTSLEQSAVETETLPYRAIWATSSGDPGAFPAECGNTIEGVVPFGIFGEGRARGLGVSEFVAISYVDDSVAPADQRVCAIYTAANGDELYVETVGIAQIIGPFVNFSGDLVFTGGTGRFEGASGGGTYEGEFSFITNTGELRETGELTLVSQE